MSKRNQILAVIATVTTVIAVGAFIHYLPEITAFVNATLQAIADFFSMVLHTIWEGIKLVFKIVVGTFLTLAFANAAIKSGFSSEKLNEKEFYRKNGKY